MSTRRRGTLPLSCLIVAGALIILNFVLAYLIVSGAIETWLGR